MADQWRVLCLDEFHVVDIGDAVILAGLYAACSSRALSWSPRPNVAPDQLYRDDGIQRASFLPAIALLNTQTQVMELGGDRDYRKMILEQARVYHTPLGEQTDALLFDEFHRLASTAPEGAGDVMINGRAMPYRHRAGDLVWFDFEALCGPPRSKNDYIEAGADAPDGVHLGYPDHGWFARRSDAAFSSFWSTSLRSAGEAGGQRGGAGSSLYIGERLAFEFQRTVSRLTEMQTAPFLGKQHLC